ncbi:MAG TPA: FAD-dependent oxidoreductase, partial [Chitinophagaceae bacterium]|nr:FAD-dependent oxidoreductase [Chitinophagaceae bacterium]
NEHCSTDIVVVGAGITGALVAWHLSKEGIPLIVLDKRHVGMGSTAASTSLLQYEIDTPLHELQKSVGSENAAKSYLLCKESIYELGKIARQLDLDVDFGLRSSLQYASRHSHVKKLQKEFNARKAIGIDLNFLEETDIKKLFHFKKPAGLLSKDGGQVDAYKMTHALLNQVESWGNKVFDLTPVTGIKHLKRGVEIKVKNKFKIKARKLIIACGYESQQYIPKRIEDLDSTFAIISEPFPQQEFWYENSLIWETSTPYLYMKVTADYRILVGGKDVPYYDPLKRDIMTPAKSRQLQNSFSKLFPRLEFKTDFQWAGTFSSTKDGLPYIGSIPERPHTLFALGFGGNGITFSQIASIILSDHITGRTNRNSNLFSFNR